MAGADEGGASFQVEERDGRKPPVFRSVGFYSPSAHLGSHRPDLTFVRARCARAPSGVSTSSNLEVSTPHNAEMPRWETG